MVSSSDCYPCITGAVKRMNQDSRVPESEIVHDNIRKVLVNFVGRTIVDITQDDDGDAFVEFLFDDGNSIRFPIDSDTGFFYSDDTVF